MKFVSTKAAVRSVHGYQTTLPGTRTSHGNASALSLVAPKMLLRSRGASESRRKKKIVDSATSAAVNARVAGGRARIDDVKFGIVRGGSGRGGGTSEGPAVVSLLALGESAGDARHRDGSLLISESFFLCRTAHSKLRAGKGPFYLSLFVSVL